MKVISIDNQEILLELDGDKDTSCNDDLYNIHPSGRLLGLENLLQGCGLLSS